MEQRPSLFNYGTTIIAQNSQLLCAPIVAAPEVTLAGNPLITVMDPLPVIGTTYGMNFCVQLAKGEIDFYPGNIFTLPPDLNPPLPAQSLALHFLVCAGIGCPTHRVVIPSPFGRLAGTRNISKNIDVGKQNNTYLYSSARQNEIGTSILGLSNQGNKTSDVTVLPTSELECFCLDLFATGGCSIIGYVGNQMILPHVDGIDIAELAPTGLEKSIECYALVALNDGILPSVGSSISSLAFGMISLPNGMGALQVSASTIVPNNPAIEDNQLKAFINLDEIDIIITTDGGGGGSGGSGSVTRTTRPRTRTGTFDLTAAVSANALEKIFDAFIKGFKFSKTGSGTYGPVSVNYQVSAHLESGSIQLTSSGGVEMKDLVVRWDTLYLDLGFNIPSVCTPSFCLVPIPLDGCAVDIPAECLFEDNPDFSIGIDIGGFIDSKISVTGIPQVFYGIGSGVPNQWQIAAMPTLPIYLEIIDIADTAADLFQTLIVNSIDSLISGLPGWAQDLINAVLGDVEDIIRTALGIPDDIGEWFIDMISDVGIFQDLVDAITQYFTITLFELDDPYPVLPGEGSLIPVGLPIQFLGITVNTSEMVLQADIGD
jgi:hypothetical protein